MTKERYERLMAPIRRRPKLHTAVRLAAKWLPFVTAGGFCLMSLFLLLTARWRPLLLFMLPCALCFGIVTVVRRALNRPRPYDVLHFEPLCPYRPGKGKSTPSRHTAAAFVIALAFWQFGILWGLPFTVVAVLIGLSRVVCGMHWPHDVLLGVAAAVVCAVPFFFFL